MLTIHLNNKPDDAQSVWYVVLDLNQCQIKLRGQRKGRSDAKSTPGLRSGKGTEGNTDSERLRVGQVGTTRTSRRLRQRESEGQKGQVGQFANNVVVSVRWKKVADIE